MKQEQAPPVGFVPAEPLILEGKRHFTACPVFTKTLWKGVRATILGIGGTVVLFMIAMPTMCMGAASSYRLKVAKTRKEREALIQQAMALEDGDEEATPQITALP